MFPRSECSEGYLKIENAKRPLSTFPEQLVWTENDGPILEDGVVH
jgi:hypothetical protein